jgi:hypothetical protein
VIGCRGAARAAQSGPLFQRLLSVIAEYTMVRSSRRIG